MARKHMGIPPSASPLEAAAIIAAIRRFAADHAPVIVDDGPRVSPWHRAAMLEATGRSPDGPSPWGDPVPWGTAGPAHGYRVSP